MSDKPEPKKVATGRLAENRLSFGKKMVDIFFAEGIKGVIDDVTKDVIVPSLKNMLYDALTRGASVGIYGKNKARPGTKTGIAGGSTVFVNYDKLSERPLTEQKTESGGIYRGLISEVLFDTRDEALRVREEVFERLEEFGVMSVRDLCSMASIKSDWAKESYGWDIDHIKSEDVEIAHVREGWLLRMPKPRAIL